MHYLNNSRSDCDLLAKTQAKASPWARSKFAKVLEDVLHNCLRDTRTGVSDTNGDAFVPNLDLKCDFSLGCVLHSIGQEIHDDLSNAIPIAVDHNS